MDGRVGVFPGAGGGGILWGVGFAFLGDGGLVVWVYGLVEWV